jgi:hypothetical protein
MQSRLIGGTWELIAEDDLRAEVERQRPES